MNKINIEMNFFMKIIQKIVSIILIRFLFIILAQTHTLYYLKSNIENIDFFLKGRVKKY